MFTAKNYVRAKSLEEAYELNQKKSNRVVGGMLWLKMTKFNVDTIIDLCDLGLDKIEETDNEFRIGAMVSLSALENSDALNAYTCGAMKAATKHIVGTQFRNCATVGGSIWGRYGFSDVLALFMGLGAKVELYKAGVMDIADFAAMDRKTRDILVSVIIPKDRTGIAYRSQRNVSTDFPVCAVAVAKTADGYVCSIGARPLMAKLVKDTNGILADGVTEDAARKFAAEAAAAVSYGKDIRSGSEYRKRVCEVLIRRALLGGSEE